MAGFLVYLPALLRFDSRLLAPRSRPFLEFFTPDRSESAINVNFKHISNSLKQNV